MGRRRLTTREKIERRISRLEAEIVELRKKLEAPEGDIVLEKGIQ